MFSQVLRKQRDVLRSNDDEVSRLREAGREVNVRWNLASFVRENKTHATVPPHVIQHLDLSRDLLNIEEKATNFFYRVDKDYPNGVQPKIWVPGCNADMDAVEYERLSNTGKRVSRALMGLKTDTSSVVSMASIPQHELELKVPG